MKPKSNQLRCLIDVVILIIKRQVKEEAHNVWFSKERDAQT